MSSLEIEKLGQYRLLEAIGNGGMARVYRATQEGDHGFSKPVALKLLKPQLAADPESVDAFISEARLGSLLSHPNIVAVLNFGQLEQFYFLAMELMEGPTLFEVLTCHQRLQRRIPPSIVFQLIRQVCEGLGYAHQAVDRAGQPLNVVHRDLKPSNILLSWHGVAKLGDFGVARAESNLLHTRVGGIAKGTAQYMAPEQAWGELELTPRTDLFALGLMLLHLLNLQHPYQAKSPEAMLRKAQEAQLEESIAALPELPGRGRVQELLRRLLQVEPSRRFDSAESLALALEEVQALQPAVRLVPWLQELRQLGLNPSAVVGLNQASENVSGKSGGRNSSGKSFAPEAPPLTPTTPARPVLTAPSPLHAQNIQSPVLQSQPSALPSMAQAEEELPSQTLAIPGPKEKFRPLHDEMSAPPAEATMVVSKARRGADISPTEALRRKNAQESARTELLSGAEVAETLRRARAELEEVTGVQHAPSRTHELLARPPQPLESTVEASLSMPLVDWPDESSKGLPTMTAPVLPGPAQPGPAQLGPARPELVQKAGAQPTGARSRTSSPPLEPGGHEPPASARPVGPIFGGAAARPMAPLPEPAWAPHAAPSLPPARAAGPATSGPATSPALGGIPASVPTPGVGVASIPPSIAASPSAPPAQHTTSGVASESTRKAPALFIGLAFGLLLVGTVVLAPMLIPAGPDGSAPPAIPQPGPVKPTPTQEPGSSATPGATEAADRGSSPTLSQRPPTAIKSPVKAEKSTQSRGREPVPPVPPVYPEPSEPEPPPKTIPSSNVQNEGFGQVTLSTVPPDHKVSVNNDDPRQVPVSRLKLSAGHTHQVRFYCDDTLSKQLSITLKSDEKRTIVWDCVHGTFLRER